MGVGRNNGNHMLFLIYLNWIELSDDQRFTDAAYATIDDINAAVKTLEVADPYVYLKYAGQRQRQNPVAGYGEDKVEKIRALSRKYDSQGVFQKLVPGAFKIPGMETATKV